MKRVYLIRHGEAEFTGHGRADHGRALAEEGREQARHLGELLADADIGIILSSSADRAVQTAEGLGLPCEVRVLDALYNASTGQLLAALSELDETVDAATLVAHAPGVPALVDELAGPGADPEAAGFVKHHFPTATCAGVEFTGSWSDIGVADTRLFWAARG